LKDCHLGKRGGPGGKSRSAWRKDQTKPVSLEGSGKTFIPRRGKSLTGGILKEILEEGERRGGRTRLNQNTGGFYWGEGTKPITYTWNLDSGEIWGKETSPRKPKEIPELRGPEKERKILKAKKGGTPAPNKKLKGEDPWGKIQRGGGNC